MTSMYVLLLLAKYHRADATYEAAELENQHI